MAGLFEGIERWYGCNLAHPRRRNKVTQSNKPKHKVEHNSIFQLSSMADAISFPESTFLLVSTKTQGSGIINFQRPRFKDRINSCS